ncbi:hypothetical protein C8Q74DRAFT_1273551 [Fomes fomentarius]|nr:hypothetical protein C8Q74DRAFT_1273551 [Fomes fomentarius]
MSGVRIVYEMRRRNEVSIHQPQCRKPRRLIQSINVDTYHHYWTHSAGLLSQNPLNQLSLAVVTEGLLPHPHLLQNHATSSNLLELFHLQQVRGEPMVEVLPDFVVQGQLRRRCRGMEECGLSGEEPSFFKSIEDAVSRVVNRGSIHRTDLLDFGLRVAVLEDAQVLEHFWGEERRGRRRFSGGFSHDVQNNTSMVTVQPAVIPQFEAEIEYRWKEQAPDHLDRFSPTVMVACMDEM